MSLFFSVKILMTHNHTFRMGMVNNRHFIYLNNTKTNVCANYPKSKENVFIECIQNVTLIDICATHVICCDVSNAKMRSVLYT